MIAIGECSMMRAMRLRWCTATDYKHLPPVQFTHGALVMDSFVVCLHASQQRVALEHVHYAWCRVCTSRHYGVMTHSQACHVIRSVLR